MVRLSTVLVGLGIVFVIVPFPIPGIGFISGFLLILLAVVLRLLGL